VTDAPVEVKGGVELPAIRTDIELHTADGLTLVGELAVPVDREPVATLLTLHPLPTAGGFMDSHVLRKAAARLPAQAGFAVLRFNFRSASSPRGRSEGEFGDGETERFDLEAAVSFVRDGGLPTPWLVGWSFGTEVALKHGLEHDIAGAILLSPPLRRARPEELARWAGSGRRLVALIPEFDDFLRPTEAREKFATVPGVELIEVENGKHLWVGEIQTRRVLSEIVRVIEPDALPLSEVWPEPSRPSES
jgi:alpha/beta superfamily hydrolase